MDSPSEQSSKWRSVLARDGRADGKFVYAVRTTGIYCRPTCPSRRPKPESVEFYLLQTMPSAPAIGLANAANRISATRGAQRC